MYKVKCIFFFNSFSSYQIQKLKNLLWKNVIFKNLIKYLKLVLGQE